jgi:hypothetical protein
MRMKLTEDKHAGGANALSPDVQLGHFVDLERLDISGALAWRDSLPNIRPLYTLERLGASLAKLRRLLDVRLCNNNLTFADMKLLGKWIDDGALSNIVHSDLSGNDMVATRGAATILTAAAALEHLVCLHLARCNVGSGVSEHATAEGMDKLRVKEDNMLRYRTNGRGTVDVVAGGTRIELLATAVLAVAGKGAPRQLHFCRSEQAAVMYQV